ncbi:MAG: hypothetical protein MZW92_35865 [Comamonadaceae bacterium]|nr:hypothetical protein [Comamonadaceae bacterium]
MMVAAPGYLAAARHAAAARRPARSTTCLIYSTVQGDDALDCSPARDGRAADGAGARAAALEQPVGDAGGGARAAWGWRSCPATWRATSLARRRRRAGAEPTTRCRRRRSTPSIPSPKFVPAKVSTLISFLAERLQGEWWRDLGPSA